MRRVAASFAAALVMASAPAQAQESDVHHATGTFEVTITPEAQAEAPEGGVATSRMALSKQFSGGLTGTATGTMLAAGTPTPGSAAYYVAIDQFHGTLDGRSGGFVLLHQGTMTRDGGGALSIVIADDSGTGALAGIAGTLTIDVREDGHFYDLEYRLPEDD